MGLTRALRRIGMILALAVCGSAAAAPVARSYKVYVAPQLGPEIMHRAWTPLLEAVSRETGIGLTLAVPPSIAGFEALLLRGLPDFAFANPYMVLPARKAQGYLPLARNGKTRLVGLLLVRKDSPVKTLQDLDGATIAFPAPNAFAAALYIRAQLARANVRFTPVYVGTHNNVYRHVLFGESAAGGGVNISLDREPEEIRSMMRPVYSTPPLVPHAFVGHPRVPAADRAAIVEAMLRVAARPEGRAMFAAAQMPEPVRADYARDYAPLESLDLDRFLVFGSE